MKSLEYTTGPEFFPVLEDELAKLKPGEEIIAKGFTNKRVMRDVFGAVFEFTLNAPIEASLGDYCYTINERDLTLLFRRLT